MNTLSVVTFWLFVQFVFRCCIAFAILGPSDIHIISLYIYIYIFEYTFISITHFIILSNMDVLFGFLSFLCSSYCQDNIVVLRILYVSIYPHKFFLILNSTCFYCFKIKFCYSFYKNALVPL